VSTPNSPQDSTFPRRRKGSQVTPDAHRAQAALGRVVVDGDAAVLEEKAEGGPAVQGVAERPREVALAGDVAQLLLGPVLKGLNLRPAVRPAAPPSEPPAAGR
jgi:hypothetical protein